MKVSVIIPAYNSSSFIEKSIQSVLNQSYSEFELIVVDDGSSDNTVAVVQSFQQFDSRIHLYKKENGGVSSARNVGIEKAKGEYIIFLDSDDWLESDTIEFLVKRQYEASGCLIACDCYYVSAEITPFFQNKDHKDKTYSLEEAICSYSDNYLRLNSACYKLFSTSIIRNNNLSFHEDVYYGEDGLFTFEYLLHVSGLKYYASPKWYILDRPSSASNGGYNSKMKTMPLAMELMIEASNGKHFLQAHEKLIQSQIKKTFFLSKQCIRSAEIVGDELPFYRNILRKYRNDWKKCKGLSIIKVFIVSYFPICILKLFI